jgi:hypothetical protein
MEFNTNKYRVYNWTHFMMIHWIINPGLAFNELVLGQRVPKVMLEDKTSAAPRAQRSVIPCPIAIPCIVAQHGLRKTILHIKIGSGCIAPSAATLFRALPIFFIYYSRCYLSSIGLVQEIAKRALA